ncbi:hypothetical protein D3C85_1812520 [compost metagenome]
MLERIIARGSRDVGIQAVDGSPQTLGQNDLCIACTLGVRTVMGDIWTAANRVVDFCEPA